MVDWERRCMSIILLSILWFFLPGTIVNGHIFGKNFATIYDHVRYGEPSKSMQITSELRIVTEYLPEECEPVDEQDLFEDRQAEIVKLKGKLRQITAEGKDTVTLHYTLSFTNGTKITSSRGEEGEETPPVSFKLGTGLVIQGWEEGIRGMCVGEKRRLVIPPQLGYGSVGNKELKIPPDAMVEIEMELLHLSKKDYVDYFFDFLHTMQYFSFLILGLSFLLQGYYKRHLSPQTLIKEQTRKQRIKKIRKVPESISDDGIFELDVHYFDEEELDENE
ncbi:hypothetical protein CHS0354_000954 [Potamilus streckersoni]|uniref:peptidylprolyl isomerase n=1 Tax=Potamilus streckersoni TaxID=2493646 RepID=A0AAE0W1Z2_9BIVA|nr:hypothetical protein CHS0354_000954 [Potamilus streckersoni]